jgi:polyphosphate glucokinase
MKILGIDVGGSGIKGAIANLETGEPETERFRVETPQPANPKNIVGAIKTIITHFNWKGKIGVGFPAIVQNGVVKTATNIDKSCINVNFEKLISAETGCITKLLNDADAAAVAEINFGQGKNENGLILMITVGTGVGAALFYKKMLIPNMEFGHIYLPNGKWGEKYISDASRKNEDLDWQTWTKRFNEYINHLGFLVSPELIIIGGGISKKWDKVTEYIKSNFNIKPAKLKNFAGIIGAAYYSSLSD